MHFINHCAFCSYFLSDRLAICDESAAETNEAATKSEEKAPESKEEVSWTDPWSPPSPRKHPFYFLAWVPALPITVPMAITIPKCLQEKKNNGWCISLMFIISIIWIGIFSYGLVGFAWFLHPFYTQK